MQLLEQGEVDEVQRLTAAIGEPLASKDFQEQGDLLLKNGNFADAIRAYRGAALSAEVSKAVFQRVLTAIEAAVKEGRAVIDRHGACDAAHAYCQAYEEAHGQPPSPEQLVSVGDSARQRKVMNIFFQTALLEVARRISSAPINLERNKRKQDFYHDVGLSNK